MRAQCETVRAGVGDASSSHVWVWCSLRQYAADVWDFSEIDAERVEDRPNGVDLCLPPRLRKHHPKDLLPARRRGVVHAAVLPVGGVEAGVAPVEDSSDTFTLGVDHDVLRVEVIMGETDLIIRGLTGDVFGYTSSRKDA